MYIGTCIVPYYRYNRSTTESTEKKDERKEKKERKKERKGRKHVSSSHNWLYVEEQNRKALHISHNITERAERKNNNNVNLLR